MKAALFALALFTQMAVHADTGPSAPAAKSGATQTQSPSAKAGPVGASNGLQGKSSNKSLGGKGKSR